LNQNKDTNEYFGVLYSKTVSTANIQCWFLLLLII